MKVREKLFPPLGRIPLFLCRFLTVVFACFLWIGCTGDSDGSSSSKTAPPGGAPDFTDNGDGTVTDNATKLLWQKADDGSTRNWDAARTYCDGFVLAGKSDWRLPSIRELRTIVDYARSGPAAPAELETDNAIYFSSTVVQGDANSAWGVNFQGGFDTFQIKSSRLRARCVSGSALPALTFLDLSSDGDRVTRDVTNGLSWQYTADGRLRIWADARTYCENLDYGGRTDWDLPTMPELLTKGDYGRFNPASDPIHGLSGSTFWSSTVDAGDASKAWTVNFIWSRRVQGLDGELHLEQQ